VPAEWVHESARAGRWLPEQDFGGARRNHRATVVGKRFFLTAAFRKDDRFDATAFNQLIVQLGGGKIIHPKPVDIDYTLCVANDPDADMSGGNCLLWDEFVELLQPAPSRKHRMFEPSQDVPLDTPAPMTRRSSRRM